MVSIHPLADHTTGQTGTLPNIGTDIWHPLSNKFPRLFAMLVLLLCSPWAAADSFTASVDRSQLTEQETFQLVLTFSPLTIMGSPDIAPLTQDFDIVGGPQQMTSHRSINGRTESKTQWTYLLMPKRLGKLTIPPIEFKGELTDSITLTVTEVPQAVRQQQEKDVFFDIQINQQDNYYVQSQIVYVEKLYYRVNHQDANLTPLEVEGARIEELQEPKNYTTVINGERTGVYERRFAIFPERAGSLVIPGQRFQAIAVSRNFNSWSSRTRTLSATSGPITLNISPIPDSYPLAPWLPAQQLDIKEVWSEDPTSWQVGVPVTRTIRIQSDGLPASQIVLPDMGLPSSLKQYPDQTGYQDAKKDTGIVGVFTQPYALKPTQTGELIIPELRIPWWNTRSNRQEYAVIPERRLNITPQANAAEAQNASGNTKYGIETTPIDTMAQPTNASDSGPWMLMAATLLLSNFVTGFLLWRKLVTPTTTDDVQEAPHTSEARQWRLLRKACQQQGATEIRQYLIQWMSTLISADNKGGQPTSLTAVQEHLKASGELSQLLKHLDQSLFAYQQSANSGQFCEEDGKQLLSLLEQQRSRLLKKRQNRKKYQIGKELPTLHGAAH